MYLSAEPPCPNDSICSNWCCSNPSQGKFREKDESSSSRKQRVSISLDFTLHAYGHEPPDGQVHDINPSDDSDERTGQLCI